MVCSSKNSYITNFFVYISKKADVLPDKISCRSAVCVPCIPHGVGA